MKTAILISGHTRSFKWIFDNQCREVFSRFKEPVFFCSVVDDEHGRDIEELKTKFPESDVFIEYVKEQPDCVKLVGEKIFPKASRNYIDTLFKKCMEKSKIKPAPHASPQTIFSSLWHQQRVWELCQKSQVKDIGFYVRHRPDLLFTTLEMPATIADNECYVPWWASWGGINDRWAVMGPLAASAYFTCFDGLPVMLTTNTGVHPEGCPLHPEALSGENLRRNLITVKPLNCDFSALRVPVGDKVDFFRPNYSVTDIYNLVKNSKS